MLKFEIRFLFVDVLLKDVDNDLILCRKIITVLR